MPIAEHYDRNCSDMLFHWNPLSVDLWEQIYNSPRDNLKRWMMSPSYQRASILPMWRMSFWTSRLPLTLGVRMTKKR